MMSDAQRYLDTSLGVDERAAALLRAMTLDEKIAQLGSCWAYQLLDGSAFSPEKAGPLLGAGIGHITRIGGSTNATPRESASLANGIQRFLRERTRLGIPAVVHEECCSGYMANGATVFPQALGVASTWDPDLVEAMSAVIREQMRSVGAHHALAPVLDIARDARWGRVEETFGEDPYLTARMGVAFVRALQGDSLATGIIATAKHFAGHGASEGGLNWAPPHIDQREFLEVYLLPFEAAVREAGLASVMNAYHELDGIPCASSRELLTGIVREAWGFDGTLVADYFSIRMLFDYHRVASDKGDAARMALEAGIDVELPATDCYGGPLKDAIASGRVPLALADRAARKVLAQKFALGLFEHPYVDEAIVVFDTPAQRELARTLAQKSMVLLKNDGGLLPLSKHTGRVAVIGPNANTIRNLFGDYSYPAHIETMLESMARKNVFGVPSAPDIRLLEDFIPAITVLQAIRDKGGASVEVRYARGCGVREDSTADFADAVEAARWAEVAILVMGDKAGLTEECTSGEGRDRAILDLPGVQAALVRAVYETGTPVVLVLVNGRPLTLGWMADEIPAILEAWFPSEEGANAIADVLFGDANPGGKLPMSFPEAVGQVPVYYGHKPSGGRSHWTGHYVDTSALPRYPFGHGLSYTTFTFASLRITPDAADATGTVRVQLDVTNTGARAGDEVVQLYTRQQPAGITRPVLELRGFQRVTLEPGATTTVTFELDVAQLAFYDRDFRYAIAPGDVEVLLGSSSRDIHLTGAFTITGEAESVRNKVFFSRVRAGAAAST